jgi:general secretion pathway protein D
LLLPLVLGVSACQTIDEAPTSSSWSSTPSVRTSEGQMRPDRTSSAPLLANTRGGQSTVIEGSGRFIGEPPTGAIGRPPEDVTDGVTLNLVNVPAPLAGS